LLKFEKRSKEYLQTSKINIARKVLENALYCIQLKKKTCSKQAAIELSKRLS